MEEYFKQNLVKPRMMMGVQGWGFGEALQVE
jgi:hypothetical protein